MRITKVYTRGGDRGETRLAGGERVLKDDPRIEAYGTVDELSCAIGIARATLFPPRPSSDRTAERLAEIAKLLCAIQQKLFDLGGSLATARAGAESPAAIDGAVVRALEDWIDHYNQDLPPLSDFVLPGGHEAVATLHLARTIARRAERRMVTLHRSEALRGAEIAFINRLSDLLFVLARAVAAACGTEEEIWHRGPFPSPPTGGSDS